jgi:5-methylcytosine-specific restriction enzyme subunit McrC
MMLTEWQPAEAMRLSASGVATLRERYARQIDVRPSWAEPGTYDVTPRGFVGAINLGDTDLILVPKVPLDTAIYMVAESELLLELGEELAPFAEASLTSVVADWFSKVVGPLVERSLVRRYRLITEEGTFIRGRVDVASSVRLGMGGRPELACAFDDYTADVVENQVLLAATHVLLRAPGLPGRLAARLRRIAAMLAEVRHRVPARWERRAVVFDRLNGRYRPALRLAEWILARASPEIDRAEMRRHFQAFLIDMGDVFERFVVGQLMVRLAREGFGCWAKPRRWLDVGGRTFETEPDLVVRAPDGRPVIVDAKYKRLGEKFRPSQSDIYQMITYCVTRRARSGVLVYPRLEPDAGFSATIANAGVALTFYPVEVGSGREALHRSLDGLAAYVAGGPVGLDAAGRWIRQAPLEAR